MPIADTYPHWLFDGSPIPDPFGYGERAVRFIRALKHPKTSKAFQLDLWGERIVRRVYGDCNPDGTRKIRNVVMMVPRGARKTTLGAALALLHTIGPERVQLGQVVLAAYDREQARIAYDEAFGIVHADRRIVAATRIVDSRHRIVHRKSRARLQAVSADANAQNGKTPSFVLFDEVHAWRDRKLYDVMKTGLGKTRNTLSFVISQAGRGNDNLAFEIFDHARKVAADPSISPTTLPILFETAPDADWQDEAVWYRVNPGLAFGYPPIETLREDAGEALHRPAMLDKFKNDHLNIWLDHSAAPFVLMSVYDEGAKPPIDLDALKGEPCWLGVDLSANTDLSVIVAAWNDDDGGYTVVPWFFIPTDRIEERERLSGAPYRQWVKDGLVTATPGNVVSFAAVEDKIRELHANFDVRETAVDPAMARTVFENLEEDRLPAFQHRQGSLSMMPAIAELERAIIGGKFRHGGNPVLRFCFANVEVETNSHGHKTRFTKSKKWLSIDGAVAAAMAVNRASAGEKYGSMYDDPAFSIDDWIS